MRVRVVVVVVVVVVDEVARHPPWPVEEAPRVVEYNRQMILARLDVTVGRFSSPIQYIEPSREGTNRYIERCVSSTEVTQLMIETGSDAT